MSLAPVHIVVPGELPLPPAPRPRGQKATDQELTDAYRELGSCWKVGDRFGMGGQTVHERLAKLRVIKPMNVFTGAEIERLKRDYWVHADAGRLGELAADMGRRKSFICTIARELGLTDKNRKRPYHATWKYVSEENARIIFAKFKRSSMGLGKFCAANGYDDLGFTQCMKRYFGDEWEHVIESKAPAQSMYRLGRQFEYRVRDAMKMAGYFVTRSPASKSPIDLVAIKAGSVVLIQCKRGAALQPKDWNAIYDLAESVGGVAVLATMPRATGMELWRLIGRKDGSKSRQPFVRWSP